ncbi:hypothetical protein ScPMuIL_009049 [Solemya velum]
MEYPCSGCGREARPRQEALCCDECERWRHRICDTGMPRSVYGDLTKKQKNGEEFQWRCPECSNARPTDTTTITETMFEMENRLADNFQDGELEEAMDMSGDFNVNVSIEQHHEIQERSLREEVPSIFPEERPLEWQTLKAVKTSLSSTFDLDEVVCDFEAAIWGAVKEVFPSVTIHGCTFHWCQAVYRKINELGLQTAYKEKGPVFRLLKKLLALPYLPRRHIRPTFDELRQQAGTSEKLVELFIYTDATWFQSSVWGPGTMKLYCEELFEDDQMAANGMNGFRATNGQNGIMNNNEQNGGVKTRTKLGALGPDGYPRLPPINKPTTQKTDPYVNSKLMTYRLANHKQALLMKIMHENAIKAYEETKDFNETAPEKPKSPEYPEEMMGEDRQSRLNYQFMKKCVESGPVTPMQKEWAHQILKLLPEPLRTAAYLKEHIKDLFEEVKGDYKNSMKKSMIQQVLVKPDVKGLEDEEAGPPPEEPVGLDYSSPWHGSFLAARETIRDNLHCLHPTLSIVLNMCQTTLGSTTLVDCSGFRAQGPMEFESMKNNVILDLEKSEDKLMHSWYPGIINVFAEKSNITTIKSEKMDSFYNCVTTLVSNQLKGLLVRSIDSYVTLFDLDDKQKLPILKMELTFDDQMMQFYPPVEDLEESVLFPVYQICKTMQQVPTVQSWLSGGSTINHTDVAVADHFLKAAIQFLKNAVKVNFEEPKAHLQSFVDRYEHIVNGQALQEITLFMEEEHSFQEYSEYIEKFRTLAREIMSLPSIEHFDMLRLDCEDLKRGLAEASRALADVLLKKVSDDHRKQNKSICQEFETIKERALKLPETSEDLMEMISFVEKARAIGMIQLNEQIEASRNRLAYLLDVYMFSSEDIQLNSDVLNWPTLINPVFDENDELIEKSKQSGEKSLNERKEKVMMELEKLRQRVDEFNDYGELDMMQQYVQDVRVLQKRLAETRDQIEWINKEELLYKYPVSQFPDVEEITSSVDPFMRLFTVVLKWQKAEKKYMDGAFLELDAENVDAEVDEYTRDIYKIQKVFNIKIKKMQMEIDERNREKKKKRRHAEEGGDAAPEDEDDSLHIPQGANICKTVQDQMIDFKDTIPVIAIMCNRGMRPRHWEKMSDIAGFDITPDSGTTLRKVLKLNLESFMEQFEGISAAATKVIYYSTEIFMSADLTEETAQYATVGTASVNVMMTFVSALIMDRGARPPL